MQGLEMKYPLPIM